MRRTSLTLLIALTVSLMLTACGGSSTTAPPTKINVPDVVGRPLPEARKALEAVGFKVVAKAPGSTFGVVNEANWVVAAQAPTSSSTRDEGSTIALTVERPAKSTTTTTTPAQIPTTVAAVYPLDQFDAMQMCKTYGEDQFPYGFKLHSILGAIAEEWQGDHWFLKYEADVTNEFGATRDATVECKVGGTNAAPEMIDFLAY